MLGWAGGKKNNETNQLIVSPKIIFLIKTGIDSKPSDFSDQKPPFRRKSVFLLYSNSPFTYRKGIILPTLNLKIFYFPLIQYSVFFFPVTCFWLPMTKIEKDTRDTPANP